MARRARGDGSDTRQRFDAFDTASLLAFCVSVPLFVPVLTMWQGLTASTAPAASSFLPIVPFASAVPLSAMFTALAFLFVCLLKTAHARVSRTILVVALACYAAGYALLDLWSSGVLGGSMVETVCGLTLGFGAAVMCLVWVSRLRLLEFKRALMLVWLAACCLFAAAAGLPLLGADATRAVLSATALLALIGCARLSFGANTRTSWPRRWA